VWAKRTPHTVSLHCGSPSHLPHCFPLAIDRQAGGRWASRHLFWARYFASFASVFYLTKTWTLPLPQFTIFILTQNENKTQLITATRVMAQAVGRQPVTAKARLPSRASARWICGVLSGTGTAVSPSTSVLPCQYHSTSAPYSFIHFRRYIILAINSVVK
jgi:hypothetical protein